MDKTRTAGQNWLANELDLQFLIIRECTKFQSNRIILSKVVEYTDRQTDTIPKTIFSVQGVSKRGDLMKTRGGQILHKSSTFFDANVKSEFKKILWK